MLDEERKNFVVPVASAEGRDEDDGFLFYIRADSDKRLRKLIRDFLIENPEAELDSLVVSWIGDD